MKVTSLVDASKSDVTLIRTDKVNIHGEKCYIIFINFFNFWEIEKERRMSVLVAVHAIRNGKAKMGVTHDRKSLDT